MADNRNRELHDDVMAQAAGGMVGEDPASEFNIGDWVIMPSRPKNGKGQVKAMDFSSGVWMYTVFFPDWYGGQEYIGPGEVFEKV